MGAALLDEKRMRLQELITSGTYEDEEGRSLTQEVMKAKAWLQKHGWTLGKGLGKGRGKGPGKTVQRPGLDAEAPAKLAVGAAAGAAAEKAATEEERRQQEQEKKLEEERRLRKLEEAEGDEEQALADEDADAYFGRWDDENRRLMAALKGAVPK